MTDSAIKYVGVDGCTGGWVAVGLGDGVETCVKVFGRGEFPNLLDHFSGASVVLVDMPIGLRRDAPPCYRACDNEARCLLRERRGSVFQVPSRKYLDEATRKEWWGHHDHKDASGWSKTKLGGGISRQAFSITRKIVEVDETLLSRDKGATPEVREVHPEVCFWALNGKTPMQHRKQDDMGFDERIETLRRCAHNVNDIDVDATYEKARREYTKGQVADDDILDALAAAITAKIGCQRGGFKTLPENPPTDSKGLPMEMVYAIP